MKLNELHGYKQYLDKDLEEILNYLKLHYYEVNDNGSFSRVIISSKFAYKIWQKDEAYETYLDCIKTIPNNPFVPKLLGNTRKITLGEQFNIQKMEKLVICENNANNIALFLSDAFLLESEQSLINLYSSYKIKSKPFDLISKFIPELYQLTAKIKILIQGSALNDMWDNNFMLRGNQIVITDPIQIDSNGEAIYL